MHRYLALVVVLAASTWASASVEFEDGVLGELTARALLPTDDGVATLRRRAPCKPGQYYTTRCRACTAGSYCPDGQNRFACGAGAYSAPSESQCTLCPYGTFSNKQKTQYVTGCQTVAPGHRANAPIGATAQLTCGKGSYSNGATDTCTPCPAGSKCTSSVTQEPTQCGPGTYSNAGNGASCTACPKGTFNNVYGSTGCCSCCSGFYGSDKGATSCSSCPSGQGSAPGSTSSSRCTARNTNGVSSCNQFSDGSCPATANTVAASGGARRVRREVGCENPSHTECPIPGLEDSFECIDTQANIESCGGCANTGGVDCTAIEGIGAVACRAGSCVIRFCDRGFNLSLDRKSCEPVFRYQHQQQKP